MANGTVSITGEDVNTLFGEASPADALTLKRADSIGVRAVLSEATNLEADLKRLESFTLENPQKKKTQYQQSNPNFQSKIEAAVQRNLPNVANSIYQCFHQSIGSCLIDFVMNLDGPANSFAFDHSALDLIVLASPNLDPPSFTVTIPKPVLKISDIRGNVQRLNLGAFISYHGDLETTAPIIQKITTSPFIGLFFKYTKLETTENPGTHPVHDLLRVLKTPSLQQALIDQCNQNPIFFNLTEQLLKQHQNAQNEPAFKNDQIEALKNVLSTYVTIRNLQSHTLPKLRSQITGFGITTLLATIFVALAIVAAASSVVTGPAGAIAALACGALLYKLYQKNQTSKQINNEIQINKENVSNLRTRLNPPEGSSQNFGAIPIAQAPVLSTESNPKASSTQLDALSSSLTFHDHHAISADLKTGSPTFAAVAAPQETPQP